MSNNESFIDEVSEEVRKDRFSRVLKKWGWVGILLIIIIVGGAALNEWYKDQKITSSRSFGDKILNSVNSNKLEDLRKISTSNSAQDVLVSHLVFSELISEKKIDDAKQVLVELQDLSGISTTYDELNLFKLGLLNKNSGEMPLSDQFQYFEQLSRPGSAFRNLALEQMALILIEQKKANEAITILSRLRKDSEVTGSLYQRVTQLVISLGGNLNEN